MGISQEIQQWVREFVAGWIRGYVFRRSEHHQTSRGEASRGLPLVLDNSGKIDASFVDDADIDHGSIGGLADDDHPQYHNDARGDARYFRESEHLSTSAGAASAGKPIVLDAAGQVDATMVNDADIDHGSIGGLADDDHPQYVLNTGDTMTDQLALAKSDATEFVGVKIDNTATSADELASLLFELGSASVQAKIAAHLRAASAGSDLYFYIADSGGALTHVMTLNRSGQLLLLSSGLYFGSTSDTNLYRSAADTLKTDDALEVGGTVTSGNITVSQTTATASMGVNANAGQVRQFAFRTGGTPRWIIFADNSSESGSNAGSDLIIRSYTDAGATLENVLTFTRSNGNITHLGDLTTQAVTATSVSNSGALTSGAATLNSTLDVTGNATLNGNLVVAGKLETGGTSENALIYQDSTTAAKPPLRLRQLDLSEEFIDFTTTVGAGNAVDTAALGAYYGKLRVAVNGTFKYIPLYNS